MCHNINMSERDVSLKQAVGEGQLKDIQDSYMQYLDSSASIYEVNGDYATSLFTSTWCDFLNQASMKLCGNVSEEEALKSGKWTCHEDCWATSLKSMTDKRPVEMECSGGITIYAAPIIADDMVIGSNNAGISNPPTDEGKIKEIADRYKVSPEELSAIATQYTPRPEYVFNASRRHIVIAANTIANIFLRNQEKEELRTYKTHLEEFVKERTDRLQIEIDEQKRLSKKLLENEERFTLLTNNISEAFWIANLDTSKTLYISPAYETIWGRTCNSLYDNPRSFIDAIHPQDRESVIATLEIKKKRMPFSHEYRIIRPDGSIRWISDRGFPNATGDLALYVGVARDITEQKDMEQSLAEEKNKLQSIVDAMEDGLTIRDLEYNITYQSEINKSIFGDRLGDKCYRVFEGSDEVCEKCPVDMSYKDGRSHVSERRVKMPFGSFAYFENTANPIKDTSGKIVSCVEISSNITKRKLLENKLNEAKEQLQAIIDNTTAVIFLKDINGRYIFINCQYEELFHITKNDVIGKTDYDIFPEDLADKFRENDKAVLNEMKTIEFEELVPHDDGLHTYISIKFILFDAYGNPYGVCGIATDITTYKRLNESLKLSSLYNRSLLEASLDPLVTITLDGKIGDVNSSTEAVTGYSREELIGTDFSRYFTEPDVARIGYQAVFEYGRVQDYELSVRHRKGHVTPVLYNASVYRDETGKVIGVFAAARDITKLKIKELSLIQARNEWERTFNTIPDLIMILDTNHRIIKMNETMVKKLEITAEEAIGKACYEIFHSTEKPLDNCPHEQLLTDGLEHTIEAYDGRLNAYFMVTTTPLHNPDGKLYGSIHLARDISSIRHIQDQLFAENEKNKAMLKAIGDGVTIQNTDYRITYQNQMLIDIFGDRVGEYCYKAYENNDQICYDCPVERVFKDGNVHTSVRHVVKSDGKSAYFHNVSSPIRDVSGNIVAAIEIARDVTRQKEAEEELKLKTYTLGRLNENLEALVKSKVDELRRSEQLLIQQSKMAAMGEMIGAIAHQWKQPLNAIGLLIQDLKDANEFGELDDKYLNNAVADIMKQLDFMAKTIDEFRNFFKPSKTKETFNLIGLSLDVFSMLSPQLKINSISHRITCHIHNKTFTDYATAVICADTTVLTTYKNQLAHVLLNLINNAKDAIVERKDRGLLTTEGMISVDCYKDDRTLRLEISDNGGGIAEDIFDKVFEPYFSTKGDKGTGIGLYMSKVIIEESLGGKISARMIEGGCVFILEFIV
ncbi:multi-sensor signal transduction histidine kinase [Candidatus Magnetobacterium bavaricum]|uniref:histidine kinase n=1 Tax=Candidatus Magnetobacterium bavaricum TaxID=29290 RepID=A0A0F3GM20_9BACT|nr:multi-sensor signal transduction histidine kinase [Candidatus Magnetobacterium bavaricum]